MVFRAGAGTTIAITELPGRIPPVYPIVSFTVTGIEGLVAELSSRGVEFLDPGSSSFQGVEGSIEGAITDYGPVKSAMLRDSEGNILALNEIMASG
jgi:hypothetical protein